MSTFEPPTPEQCFESRTACYQSIRQFIDTSITRELFVILILLLAETFGTRHAIHSERNVYRPLFGWHNFGTRDNLRQCMICPFGTIPKCRYYLIEGRLTMFRKELLYSLEICQPRTE